MKVTYGFPKVGKFKLLCVIHPKMEMVVTVKPKGAAVETAEEVAAKAKAETDAAWAKADALVALKPPKNTIYMGVDSAQASGGRTTILDFVPSLTTVKVGTRVRFVASRAPTEAHNVGFGPREVHRQAHEADGALPVRPAEPAEPGHAVLHLRQRSAGDGVRGQHDARQRLLRDAARGRDPGPPPNAVSVTFAKAGKYSFICMLHGPDMAADIRVTR